MVKLLVVHLLIIQLLIVSFGHRRSATQLLAVELCVST